MKLEDRIREIIYRHHEHGTCMAANPIMELLSLVDEIVEGVIGKDESIYMDEQKTDVDLGRKIGEEELKTIQRTRYKEIRGVKGGDV